tara:strand:+ start:282 stop:1325 length:1044 start_codon:yes stop_codon:yes gene_type:complete
LEEHSIPEFQPAIKAKHRLENNKWIDSIFHSYFDLKSVKMKKTSILFPALISLSISVSSGSDQLDDGRSADDLRYGFINNTRSLLRYYRINLAGEGLSLVEGPNNNSILDVSINTRRNNFEEAMMLGFASVGKAITYQLEKAGESEGKLFYPSIITVQCRIPLGRNGTSVSASANSKIVIQFVDGTMPASQFWWEIHDSFQTVSDMMITSETPVIFNADVDYENLVSSRIALENMNNPRVSGLISMATKAKYVWGLEAKLESIVLDQMKTNHIDMMEKVLGVQPAEDQIIRIGKQVFYYIKLTYPEVEEVHTTDSLRYVWGGRRYPASLDEYYRAYNLKYNIRRPPR